MAYQVGLSTVIDDDKNIINIVNADVSGIITASSFVGDGSGLTGAGSTVADDTSTNATFYPLFTQTTSGTVTDSKVSTTKLNFNPSTGTLTATTFSGALSGNATSATSATTATTATNVTVTANNSTNETVYPVFVDGATGSQGAETDTGLTYNPSSNTLTATTFSGALSGNSTTATTLQTSRTINGVSFDGSANIITNPTTGAYSNGNGERTVSTGSPTGGSDGDIWYKY